MVCARTRPQKVATKSKRAKKKNVPEAVIMSGTISGEIIMAIINLRKGMTGRLRPNAARIPSVVARIVAVIPILRLFSAPIFQLSLQTVVMPGSEQSPIIMRYQRKENASGSNLNISGVNCKNGVEVKEIGMTTSKGITKKNRTMLHIAR